MTPSLGHVPIGTTDILGHRQVLRTRHGGPRTRPRPTDANLDSAFVENALGFVVL